MYLLSQHDNNIFLSGSLSTCIYPFIRKKEITKKVTNIINKNICFLCLLEYFNIRIVLRDEFILWIILLFFVILITIILLIYYFCVLLQPLIVKTRNSQVKSSLRRFCSCFYKNYNVYYKLASDNDSCFSVINYVNIF
jgi:hypothetical protein